MPKFEMKDDDPRTVPALFEAALRGDYDGEGDYDDDAAWDAVVALRLRGTAEVFEFAKRHCRSDDPKTRARGLDVLAQLGVWKPDSDRPYLSESVSMAIEALRDDDPRVVHSAAWALAHLRGGRAIGALIEIKRHSDPDVRKAVALGIQNFPEAVAIKTLMELMEDPDEDVRDCATFELGTLNDVDSPEVREALRKRLNDSFEDARDEAIWGLAKRKDAMGLQLLLERLEAESWVSGDEWAAEEVLGLRSGASPEELQRGLRQLLSP